MTKMFQVSQVLAGLDITANSAFAQLALNATPGGRSEILGREQASARWSIMLGDATPETGNNAGSNFVLSAYDDSGAFLSSPITIARATGEVTLDGFTIDDLNSVSIPGGAPGEVLSTDGQGNLSWSSVGTLDEAPTDGGVYGRSDAALVALPNIDEAPLDGQLYGRSDLKWLVVPPPGIADAPKDGQFYARQSGTWQVITAGTGGGSGGSGVYLPLSGGILSGPLSLSALSGVPRSIFGVTGTPVLNRWELQLGGPTAETGANAGSNFNLIAYDDTGAKLSTPLTIQRSNGVATFNNPVTFAAAITVATVTGPTTFNGAETFSNVVTFKQSIIAPTISGDTHVTGNLTVDGNTTYGGTVTAQEFIAEVPSDARIKRVLDDYRPGLNEVARLRPVAFAYIGNDSTSPGAVSSHYEDARQNNIHIGLVAQEVELAIPGMVSMHRGYIDGREVYDLRKLNNHELIYALVNAVRELKAEVDLLKAGR